MELTLPYAPLEEMVSQNAYSQQLHLTQLNPMVWEEGGSLNTFVLARPNTALYK